MPIMIDLIKKQKKVGRHVMGTTIGLFLIFIIAAPGYCFNLTAKQGADFEQSFYVAQGARVDIASFAKVDATTVQVTSAGHGLSNGARIIIVNSDYYVGTYTVANAATDTFEISAIFEKTESKADWMDAISLAGDTAEAKVWADHLGVTEIEDLDATIEDATGGQINVTLTNTEVNALSIGTYVWELTLIHADTTRDSLLSGNFIVTGKGSRTRTGSDAVLAVSDPATVVAIVGGRGPTGATGAASTPEDTAYGVDWDGDTAAASKNVLYDKIETLGGGHAAATLAAGADAILGLSAQEIDLDEQTSNYVFSGPASGVAADPTFRALVDNDVPNTITVDLAATATALAANGADCSAGNYPLGVDASGAVESCTDATTEINSAITTHAGSATVHHTATVDTNANTVCSGTTTYLDGEGNCDDISGDYEPAGVTESDISDLAHTATAITDGLIVEADLNEDSGTPTDGDVLTYDETGANFNWEAQSAIAAGTAAALAANGGNCSAGSYPLGVDASGAAESCTDATTEINSAITTHAGSATVHHTATVDTNANTVCSGTTTYLDGEGNCDALQDLSTSASPSFVAGTFTGTLTGKVGVTITTDATLDLATASNCRGQVYANGDNDAIDYTLPPLEAGLYCCFAEATFSQVVTIDTDGGGTESFILDGIALTANNAIDTAGAAGGYVCVVGLDTSKWLVLGKNGAVANGGTD